jgi:hypothetical protein
MGSELHRLTVKIGGGVFDSEKHEVWIGCGKGEPAPLEKTYEIIGKESSTGHRGVAVREGRA